MATQIHPALSVPAELSPDALHLPCDPTKLGFQTTDELPDLQDVIGQPRALRALELGSEVAGTDYNIFVLGLPGSGRTTLSKEYLLRKAAGEPIPDDWCYVNNFDNPYTPKALRLPPGCGQQFRKDMLELLALLSAIAEIPLRQDRAITGSINQHGQIQAIGGVNEKIEGFFSICKARGLSGEQGVLIPAANQRSLMLCEELVQAVADGLFHVWPVNNLDQCIPLLTGCEAGERDEEGNYPRGSFNETVTARLKTFAGLVAKRGSNGKPEMEKEKDDPS
jgi:hypothetical protein